MAKAKVEHVDIIGQPIDEGKYVAITHHNSLYIGQITKMTGKMIRVVPITGNYREGFLKYPDQAVLLSGPDAMVYILRNAGNRG